jgi:chromosomal replication initiation ATPase DnaA
MFRKVAGPEMAGQLVFPFGVISATGRQDFITAPCNQQALHFIERWPQWPARGAALYGPAGSGKTHLGAIWAQKAGAHIWAARDLAPDRLDAAGAASACLIEDLDAEDASPARDRALLELFERPGVWMVLTARTPPGEWQCAIGDLRSRFQSLIAFPVWAPDDALLSGLVVKHLADRQLRAPAAVVERIVTQIERTPSAIAAFIGRADAKALAEKRAISERLVLELLESEAGTNPKV